MEDRLVERGAIAFLYRPRVETWAPRDLEDVQRFFVLLAPRVAAGSPLVRRVVVGRKRLPDTRSHERFWAYVDRVGAHVRDVLSDVGPARYWTKTRGLRHQPGVRAVGDGAYALSRHGGHVHLDYRLERTGRPGDVQGELRVVPRARYVVAAFARSVPGGEERRFVPLAPEHLDVLGAELVLVGARPAIDDGLLTGPDAAEDARAAAGAAGFEELRANLAAPTDGDPPATSPE
jgi:hypothetical protein